MPARKRYSRSKAGSSNRWRSHERKKIMTQPPAQVKEENARRLEDTEDNSRKVTPGGGIVTGLT